VTWNNILVEESDCRYGLPNNMSVRLVGITEGNRLIQKIIEFNFGLLSVFLLEPKRVGVNFTRLFNTPPTGLGICIILLTDQRRDVFFSTGIHIITIILTSA